MGAVTGAAVDTNGSDDDLSDLLTACHDGDHAAFYRLHRHYAGIVLRHLHAGPMRGDPYADVEDIAAETWIDAWQGLLREVPRSFVGWLMTIANRRSSGYIEQRIAERRRMAALEDPGSWEPPDTLMIDLFRLAEMRGGEQWFRQLVADALASLPEKYRPVLRARIDTRAGAAELAEMLGLVTRQATRALSEGLPLLRDAMVLILMAGGQAGRPCDRFREIVADNGWQNGPLGTQLRETLARHVAHCDACQGVRTNIIGGLRYIPAFLGRPSWPRAWKRSRTESARRWRERRHHHRPRRKPHRRGRIIAACYSCSRSC